MALRLAAGLTNSNEVRMNLNARPCYSYTSICARKAWAARRAAGVLVALLLSAATSQALALDVVDFGVAGVAGIDGVAVGGSGTAGGAGGGSSATAGPNAHSTNTATSQGGTGGLGGSGAAGNTLITGGNAGAGGDGGSAGYSQGDRRHRR